MLRRPLLWLSLLLTGGLAVSGADWPKWRGPNGNGITSETVDPAGWDKEGPRRLWKAKVGVGYASAVVSQGRLYTLGNVDKSDVATLWCLDAETGTNLWQRTWPSELKPVMYDGGPNATPVIDGDRLFAVIKPARVVCLEAATGAIRLEDSHAGAMWLQLSNKSMLMNSKLGQRMADECQSPDQMAVAEAMKLAPPVSLLEGLNTGASLAKK